MNYTYTINDKQYQLIINTFKDTLPLTTPYMKYRAQIKNSTITIYTTNKLLVQGVDSEETYQNILSLITNSKPTNKINLKDKAIIGTDEVGTGDYFGGITVCSCFVPLDKQQLLINLGIKDSKEISDQKIYQLAPILMKTLTHEVILLNNEKYNEITSFPDMNLNKIKAILHNRVINDILQKNLNYDEIIVDGFTTKDKYIDYLKKQEKVCHDVNLIPKAENTYLAVACASIIARYHFLEHLKNLSLKFNINLPKGARSIVDDVLLNIIETGNEESLNKIAKLNFNNTKKVKAKLKK